MPSYINAIGTAVPDHDIHHPFISWADRRLDDEREKALFRRMAERSGIEHRWSALPRTADGGSPIASGGFYAGTRLPGTQERMAFYAAAAPELAHRAVDALARKTDLDGITHLVVASCTGFTAPGTDQLLARRLNLSPNVQRTLVGFMGCYAAVAALRVAHHIARSEPAARILVVTVELSSLHLQESGKLEELLAMLLFADGAAAALVSSEEGPLEVDRFFSATVPDSEDLIRWTIGDQGFMMQLSGAVPGKVREALASPAVRTMLPSAEVADSWAVHAGGRSILDAVEAGLMLGPDSLQASRTVLRRYGNMSSSTLMFVLDEILSGGKRVENGVALAFGPGVAAEGFAYRSAA